MLLTITCEGHNTQDIGYLLYKNPERPQQFDLSYGKAYVFYPEVSDEKTTVALLIDLDPLILAKGKLGSKDGGLFDYVNDRPYASSSFMSTAISRVFGTAMSGRCDKRPDLAEQSLNLSICLYNLKIGSEEEFVHDAFEPLGYEVMVERKVLDERFPEWGMSPYINLTLKGKVKIADILSHLYVLIPVFDRQKHYYVDQAEIDKLLEHGKDWLARHPNRNKIIGRYMDSCKSYARKAIDFLNEKEEGCDITEHELDEAGIETNERRDNDDKVNDFIRLNDVRMEAVKKAVLDSGAATVIDLGCGECKLEALLLTEKQIRKLSACDVSVNVLEKAAQRLHVDRMPSIKKEKFGLFQASLIYKDERFKGYDCACVIEVIEHIEPDRLKSFEQVLFGFASPGTIVLTTPNKEYNTRYSHLNEDEMRHNDHRFEWTREEFRRWTEKMCDTYGYTCQILGIGKVDEEYGSPTQMGVFTKNE